MLNLRNTALAAALILAFAMSANADPYSDVYEASGSVVAEVSNIKLIEPAYKYNVSKGELVPENLVEGHTVFVTMDIAAEATPVEGHIEVEGYVHCEHEANTTQTSYYLLGVPVPVVSSVNYVRARCDVYEGLVATPTIYCQVTGDWDCDPPAFGAAPVMVPTGTILPFVTPDGQQAEAEELTFVATPPGEDAPRSFYAYRVPILLPWVDAEDGLARNMHIPIPYDRLFEMDTWDFKFLHEDSVQRV